MKSFLSTLAIFTFILTQAPIVRADDTAATDVKDAASDAKMHTKKGWRKAKRKVRKATGNDSVGKDIKDGVNDAGDTMQNGAEKVKHKANE